MSISGEVEREGVERQGVEGRKRGRKRVKEGHGRAES
jgi:hypothetical protein